MNHDRLCGWSDRPGEWEALAASVPDPPTQCLTCADIARARADERRKMDAWHKAQLQSIAKRRQELTNGAQKRRAYQRGYIEGRRDEADGKSLPDWAKVPH